jgi:hypothetical protein
MFHHIDHRFTMALPPDRAQELFNEDVASELARQDEVEIVREEPGLIVLNDDDWNPAGWEDESEREEGDRPREAETGLGLRVESVYEREPLLPVHPGKGLRVEFSAENGATAVRIRGHAEKSVREALALLGTPGHWPEGRIASS